MDYVDGQLHRHRKLARVDWCLEAKEPGKPYPCGLVGEFSSQVNAE